MVKRAQPKRNAIKFIDVRPVWFFFFFEVINCRMNCWSNRRTLNDFHSSLLRTWHEANTWLLMPFFCWASLSSALSLSYLDGAVWAAHSYTYPCQRTASGFCISQSQIKLNGRSRLTPRLLKRVRRNIIRPAGSGREGIEAGGGPMCTTRIVIHSDTQVPINQHTRTRYNCGWTRFYI